MSTPADATLSHFGATVVGYFTATFGGIGCNLCYRRRHHCWQSNCRRRSLSLEGLQRRPHGVEAIVELVKITISGVRPQAGQVDIQRVLHHAHLRGVHVGLVCTFTVVKIGFL